MTYLAQEHNTRYWYLRVVSLPRQDLNDDIFSVAFFWMMPPRPGLALACPSPGATEFIHLVARATIVAV